MIEAAAKQMAEALASRGIDAAPFLADGFDAARTVAGGDEARELEILQLLAHFAGQVADRGLRLWTPFHFGVRALASLAPDDPIGFGALLSDLSLLVGAMAERDLEVELCLQQGVPAAAYQRSAELMGPLLRSAARLASRGLDPKEMLRHAAPAFESVAGGDAAKLAVVLDAVESFAHAIHESGVGPYWPIFAGVAAIGLATPGDATAFVAALKELAALIASLVVAGVSPYPVVEHGVSAAFGAASVAPWLLPEVLPLAGAIAACGGDPLRALLAGVPAIAGLGEELGLRLLGVAEAAAEEGIDPAPALAWFAPLLVGMELDAAEGSMREACRLLGQLAAHEIDPLLAFDEGFAQLQGASYALLERTLRIARLTAEQGANPGTAIKYGIVSAVAKLEPALLDALLDAAERQAAEGIDPWALLEWGTPAIASIEGDEAARLDLLARLDALVRALDELGADARSILHYTVHQPSRAMNHQRALVVALVDRIAGAIAVLNEHGIDPRASMVHGIPRVAEAAPHALEAAFRTLEALAKRRIDPAPFLSAALPALAKSDALEELLVRALAALDALGAKDARRLANAIESIAGESSVLLPVLDAIARLAAGGLDPSLALAAMVPELEGESFVALLAQAERSLLEAFEAGIDLSRDRLGLASVARAAGKNPEALRAFMSTWIRVARTLREELLPWATSAAAEMAAKDPGQFEWTLVHFAERTAAAEGELEAVFRASLRSIAALAEGAPDRFAPLLDALLRLAASPGAPLVDLLERALPLARLAAGDRPASFQAHLEDLVRLRNTGVLGEAEREIWYVVGRMRSLVEREATAWRDLIVPTIQSQGAATVPMLWSYLRLERWIVDLESIALLRSVATQEGVRAVELVHGFLDQGLASGAIRSLGAEREEILAFLRDVPIPHPEYYRRYREIAGDDALSSAEKRARIDSLHAGVAAIGAAIVRGEIAEEVARDPLFAEALFFVFPPAATLSRQQYASLYAAFADHPEHTASFPAPLESAAELPIGSYRVREGERIELAPWQPLAEAVARVHAADEEPMEIEALGRALLDAWIEGKIGQAETKRELLAQLYRHHQTTRRELPEDLGDAAHLLAYREFLSDTAKEIIQDALRAVRVAEPERYRERAAGKLSRRARVGRGLLRAVWRTIAAHREGSIDAEVAIDRLSRQLSGFDLSSAARRLELLATDEEELPELLEGLERNTPQVELGEEHLRVLGDLAGAELAAMHRELFGDAEQPAKLEYRRAPGGRTIALRFEVTKRKAHAVIGYCEGVCTASDQTLWDDPRFLQLIIWGPDQRALGGVHLFLVEADGQRHLMLPGINPSLSLLSEVGAEALLDAVIAFARQLTFRWELRGEVLVPTHRGIATNRGPIRELLDARGYPVRAIGPVQFSYRPYAYTIDAAYRT